MGESVIVAIISGVITLIGVLIANSKNQAVIEEKLKHLTEEVQKHNNFAVRIPVIENDIKTLYKKVEEK